MLVLVQPTTVIRWHRKGLWLYWTWKSRRGQAARPKLDPGVRALIKEMAEANTGWGAPRIYGGLLKLGIEVSQRTVGRLMPRTRKPPSQSWRTFLENHVKNIASMDFFVVPTMTLQLLDVLVILRHDRRRSVHVNVTRHPMAESTAQRVVHVVPWDQAPRFLSRGRDGIYGAESSRRVKSLGNEHV